MLELIDVSLERSYGLGGPFIRQPSRMVLSGLNWRSPDTGLVVIQGVAGAGKTSLLLMLAGVLRPSAGELLIDGQPTRRLGRRKRRRLFDDHLYLGQDPTAWQLEERVEEFSAVVRERAAELDGSPLAGGTTIASLSRRRRLALALGARLALDPRGLFLDDPLAGLGQGETDNLAVVIQKAAADRLVVAAMARRGSLFDAASEILELDRP